MSATTNRSSTKTNRTGRSRGPGQATWAPGRGWQGMAGGTSCRLSYDDPMCGYLRHVIAFHHRSSHDMAHAAGIAIDAIDQFMLGDDEAISFPEAAALARLVGHRLIDQSMVDALLDAAGELRTLQLKRNRIESRAWRRS